MKRILKLILYALIVALVIFIVWPEAKYRPYEPDEAYRAQALAYPITPLPQSWTDSEMLTPDGTLVRWGQTDNRQTAKASVILLPGYTSALDQYGDIAEMLLARDYHVVGMDIRGQGKSGRARAKYPEKLYVKDFSVYGDDVRALFRDLGLEGEKPVILIGTSFGGAIATRALQDHDLPVDAAFLIAPAYRPVTAPYKYETAKRMIGLARTLGKNKRYGPGQTDWTPDGLDMTQPTQCGSYPPRLYSRDALYVRDPSQRVGGATHNWFGELMENGEIVTGPERASQMTLPITMIAAQNDVVIDSPYSEDICNSGFPDCKLVVIPDTGHCLTLENDRVLKTMWSELDALLARLRG